MISQGEKFPVLRLPLFVILVISTFLFFGGVPQNQAPFEKVPFSPVVYYVVYFSVAGMLLLALWWFCSMVYRGRIVFRRTSLDIPIILLLIYVAVWIPFSPSTYLANTEFLKLLVLAGFFYYTVNNIRTKTQANFLVFSIIAATFLISVYGLVNIAILKNETVLGLQRHAGYEQRISATYICPNHFAGLLEMIIPFAISYVIMSRLKIAGKLIIGIMGLVMVTAMVLTLSRGGWAALCAGMATVGLLSICKVRVPLVAVIAPAIVTTALLVFIVASTPTLHDRVTELVQEEETSYTTRKDAWLDTAEVVKHKFFLGSGPGTYEYVITRYQRPGFFSRIDYAHNDYLQTLAEYGLIGLGIVILMIVVIARTCRRMMDNLRDHDDFACVSGFLGAFVAVGVHSFVDFNMHIPSNAMTMAAIVGLGVCLRQYRLSLYDEWVAMSGRKPKLFPLAMQCGLVTVVVLVTAGVLYLNFRAYASSLTLHRAAEKDPSREFAGQDPDRKDRKAAERLYRKAASLFASNSKPWAALADMHVAKADEALEKGETNKFHFLLLGAREAKEDYEKAADAIKKAMKRNSLDSRYHLIAARANAGIVYINDEYKRGSPTQYSASVESSHMERAEAEFQKALQMDPNNAVYHEHHGFFYYRIGRYEHAERKIQQALEILPDTPKYIKERRHLQRLLEKIHHKQGETATTI